MMRGWCESICRRRESFSLRNFSPMIQQSPRGGWQFVSLQLRQTA
jgi:hypothetical protein